MTDGRARAGVLYALAAYVVWGLLPIFWKQLRMLPASELVAHRIVWSFLLVAVLIRLRGGSADVVRALRDPRARRAMLLSTALISSNWILFIWAVNSGRILSASLGYYINPLLNVLLGRLILGERLRGLQLGAVVLAGLGVLNLALAQQAPPWISLVLAGTFGAYGLVRKMAPVEALAGLSIETGIAVVPALLFMIFAPGVSLVPDLATPQLLLLLSCGATTALPLLWFAEGARRLRFSTLGILQYVAPTLQFLCAVVVYDEAFTRAHALTFGLIWLAVGLYAVDAVRASRTVPAPAPAPAPAGKV